MADTNYRQEAEDDAKDMVEEFLDQIVEQLIEKGEASVDYNNDYSNGDSYFHESFVDRSYNLLEAAQLFDQLSEHEETYSGLWDGQMPRDAISTQAAFTYGNAVGAEWNDLISQINDDAREVLDHAAEKKEELEKKQQDLEAEEGGEQWTRAKEKELDEINRRLGGFEKSLKRRIERSVLQSIDRKPRQPEGPREWSP